MAWKETSSGLFEKPLGDVETPMLSLISSERSHPREPIRIHRFADFTAPYPSDSVVQAFRDAWKAMRLLKSPDIATTFKDGNKQYKVPTLDEVEAWLHRTFIVPQQGTTVQDVVREMQNRIELLPTCYLISHGTQDGNFKGTLALFVSHWRTEATGCLKVMNQMFDYAADLISGNTTREALSKHVPGDEIKLLTPTLEDILMPNLQPNPISKARVKKYFESHNAHLPSIDYPITGDPSAAFSAEKAIQRTYTSTSTSNFVVACRSKGVTVTAAVQSAYIGTLWQVADPVKRNRSYACIMPAQVRKRLPSSSPFRDQGCWNSAQLLLLAVPAGQDFITRAKSLRQQYAKADSDEWLYEDFREMAEQMIENTPSAPSEAVASAWFTSSGLLDGDVILPDHKDLKIEMIWGWADPIGPGIVLTLWTFRGRMNIQISWNASYHEDEQIENTIDRIEKTLMVELGVDLKVDEIRRSEF